MIRHVLKQGIQHVLVLVLLRMIDLHLPDDRRYRTYSSRILVVSWGSEALLRETSVKAGVMADAKAQKLKLASLGDGEFV